LILFIVSTIDTAGMNIAKQLISNCGFKKISESFYNNPVYSRIFQNEITKILFVNTEIVDTQFLDRLFNPRFFVFLSRHSSAKGIPTLSVHTPGNLSEAKFGGKPRKVSISPALAMKNVLIELEKLRNEKSLDYKVSYECTHHGPSLDTPTMFVELGSSPKQWTDTKAAKVIAEAITNSAFEYPTCYVSLGIGGPHYNRKFSKMALSNQRAFGHMIPKYALPQVNTEIINQCIIKTLETVNSVVLDWKGIKAEHKPKIISAIESLGMLWEKI
jgi:D-aminoacyl-tRNA deacylase